MTKTCNKCGETQALELFYKNKASKDGLQSRCKKCAKIGCTNWRKKNSQKCVEYVMKHIAKNKEYYDEYYRKYIKEYRKRPEVKKALYEKSKKHRLENPEYHYKATRKSMERLGAGVYYVLTDGGDYVGESKTIRGRIYTHSISKPQLNSCIAGKHKIISWKILELVDDKDKRKQREKYWINKFNPSLNTLL